MVSRSSSPSSLSDKKIAVPMRRGTKANQSANIKKLPSIRQSPQLNAGGEVAIRRAPHRQYEHTKKTNYKMTTSSVSPATALTKWVCKDKEQIPPILQPHNTP